MLFPAGSGYTRRMDTGAGRVVKKVERGNERIAVLFDEIGDMLDMLGESVFRVRAYRKAANSVRGMTKPLTQIYDEGGVKALEEIPGIGKHTALRLEEMIETGHMAYLDELRQKIPESLVEMMNIPGLGPKKAKHIYDALGISSVDDLKKAIDERRVEELPGFGKKSVENIKRGMAQLEKLHERILLAEAYPIASEIVDALRKQSFVERADTAGSLRRMQETVGDIDLLCAGNEPLRIMEYFTCLPQLAYVIAKGETKSSIVTHNGLQIDLRVVSSEEYGAALQYFTGSKQHNIHLRDIAKRRGLKISEYGVFDVATGKRIASETEEEIYDCLDMSTPPPVLREDRGEIEAAQEHSLPKLIQQSDIKGDFHVHSKWSDGVNTIEDMVKTAHDMGYSFICISDHAEKLRVAGGLTAVDLEREIEEIKELNARFDDIDILVGIESNIDNDGNIDFEPRVLKKLDVVIASVHSGFRQSKERITKRMIKAMQNPYVNIIGHPTGRILGRRPPYDIDLPQIFKAASETGTFLELNSYPNRLDLKDDYLREAKENFGCKFTVNTDAHTLGNLAYMEYGVATAQRGWLRKEDVINTYDLTAIRKLINEKRG
jgi:DNA polymerase (family 10)